MYIYIYRNIIRNSTNTNNSNNNDNFEIKDTWETTDPTAAGSAHHSFFTA